MEGAPNRARRSRGFHLPSHCTTLAGVYFSTPARAGREGGCGETHAQPLNTLMYLREDVVLLVRLSEKTMSDEREQVIAGCSVTNKFFYSFPIKKISNF